MTWNLERGMCLVCKGLSDMIRSECSSVLVIILVRGAHNFRITYAMFLWNMIMTLRFTWSVY